MKKAIVISAVNLRKGGTLTILKDCLSYLSQSNLTDKYRIVALVHDKQLAHYDNIEYIEIPWTIKNWTKRLWCEYVTMKKISREIAPTALWFSLHDTTPNVKADRRAVYCHNPFPFFKWKPKDILFNYRIVSFSIFTSTYYRINIHKNYKVIVQQQWLRRAFTNMFKLNHDDIIVALPTADHSPISPKEDKDKIYKFFFASYADIHKNFQCLAEATRLLEEEIGPDKFQVGITVTGKENQYGCWLKKKWGKLKTLKFEGFLDKETLYDKYAQTDCLIFPSKAETWGLPISEFAITGRPMLLSDMPYAHETAAGSKQTAFFDPSDPVELKEKMKKLIEGDTSFLKPVPEPTIEKPVVRNWQELFKELLP